MNSNVRHIDMTSASFRPILEREKLPVRTRFGDIVDVRNRGAFKPVRLSVSLAVEREAPAVVRIWNNDTCREMSINEARALAAQLLEAARHAELQNHV